MDKQTQKFYSSNHKSILAKYRAAGVGISKYFVQAFLPGTTVLEIACGSGRDLNDLIAEGYNAQGIDSCSDFVESAGGFYPELEGLVSEDSLPELKTIDENSFDGVLCSAVLMHLPEELLFDSVYSITKPLT